MLEGGYVMRAIGDRMAGDSWVGFPVVKSAVIRNNRGQKPKSLWTEIGQGDPITIRELDDEHAEARYVTGLEFTVDAGNTIR